MKKNQNTDGGEAVEVDSTNELELLERYLELTEKQEELIERLTQLTVKQAREVAHLRNLLNGEGMSNEI